MSGTKIADSGVFIRRFKDFLSIYFTNLIHPQGEKIIVNATKHERDRRKMVVVFLTMNCDNKNAKIIHLFSCRRVKGPTLPSWL